MQLKFYHNELNKNNFLREQLNSFKDSSITYLQNRSIEGFADEDNYSQDLGYDICEEENFKHLHKNSPKKNQCKSKKINEDKENQDLQSEKAKQFLRFVQKRTGQFPALPNIKRGILGQDLLSQKNIDLSTANQQATESSTANSSNDMEQAHQGKCSKQYLQEQFVAQAQQTKMKDITSNLINKKRTNEFNKFFQMQQQTKLAYKNLIYNQIQSSKMQKIQQQNQAKGQKMQNQLISWRNYDLSENFIQQKSFNNNNNYLVEYLKKKQLYNKNKKKLNCQNKGRSYSQDYRSIMQVVLEPISFNNNSRNLPEIQSTGLKKMKSTHFQYEDQNHNLNMSEITERINQQCFNSQKESSIIQ